MAGALCASCSSPIRYNQKTSGWYHANSERQDHPALPADERSGEDEVTRETAARDQVKASVKATLQKQFDYMHAEKAVNDIFKDRRAP